MDPRLDDAVRRARAGDPRAFRQVAERMAPDLVRYLTFYLGGDFHAAHDVAQDVLIGAWDALSGITDATHLRRWCYRVGRCRAVSWLRRRGPRGLRPESLDAVQDDVRSPLAPAATPRPEPDQVERALQKALRTLPPTYAGPIHLHYVRGLSTRETAELLGLTQSTVKMRLHRARTMLRREIDREIERETDSPPRSGNGDVHHENRPPPRAP